MPRIPRLIVDDVCYHIVTRGNDGLKRFIKDSDYEKYLDVLRKYKKRYHFWLYAWSLIPNHTHFVVEPNNKYGSISKLMHGIGLSYSIFFNAKYVKEGHVWQGRFQSFIVEKDEYLLNCINYVEQNPIKSGITNDLLNYPWSSYRYRVLGIKSDLLDTPRIEAKLS